MKKLLKASTAIMSVAFVAGTAHAETSIGGTGRLMIHMGSDNPSSDTMNFDQEGYYIGFSGSKKTDSGLTLAGGAYFNDSKNFKTETDNVNATWDKTSASVSGNFGKVEFTNKGDASNLSGTVTYLDAAEYGFDSLTDSVNSSAGLWRTNIEVPRGTTRINYTSPNINGLMFGVSMMNSGGDIEYDASKEHGDKGTFITNTEKFLDDEGLDIEDIMDTEELKPVENEEAAAHTLTAPNNPSAVTAADVTAAIAIAVTAAENQADTDIAAAIGGSGVVGTAVATRVSAINADADELTKAANATAAKLVKEMVDVAEENAMEAAEAAATGGHQSATSIGVSYSMAGLKFGYSTTSYTQEKEVKGFTAASAKIDIKSTLNILGTATGKAKDIDGSSLTGVAANSGYTDATAAIAAINAAYKGAYEAKFTEKSTGVATATTKTDGSAGAMSKSAGNGKYSTGWSGTRLNIGYATGPFSVGLTQTTKEPDAAMVAGEQVKQKETPGAKAARNINSTEIGLAYNYGSGAVSLLNKSEDVASIADPAAAETVSGMIISVNHNVADGVAVYLQQISVPADIDKSNEEYETISELVLGTKISF